MGISILLILNSELLKLNSVDKVNRQARHFRNIFSRKPLTQHIFCYFYIALFNALGYAFCPTFCPAFCPTFSPTFSPAFSPAFSPTFSFSFTLSKAIFNSGINSVHNIAISVYAVFILFQFLGVEARYFGLFKQSFKAEIGLRINISVFSEQHNVLTLNVMLPYAA